VNLLQFVVAFVAGVWLAAFERLLSAHAPSAPDLAALALALLLSARPSRATGLRACALLLGISTQSLDPLGAWLLGGGVAAAVILPLRDVVFVESPSSQFLFGLLCALSFSGARALYALFGQGPLFPFHLADLAPPLLTGAAVPILNATFHAAAGGWRRLRERWEARRAGKETPAAE
jgi:hypothetical protein